MVDGGSLTYGCPAASVARFGAVGEAEALGMHPGVRPTLRLLVGAGATGVVGTTAGDGVGVGVAAGAACLPPPVRIPMMPCRMSETTFPLSPPLGDGSADGVP